MVVADRFPRRLVSAVMLSDDGGECAGPASGWYVACHDGVSTHMRTVANSYVTDNNRSCAELDPVADDRAGAPDPGNTDRHIVPKQHVAPENGVVVDHQSNTMIQPHSGSHPCARAEFHAQNALREEAVGCHGQKADWPWQP